MYTSMIGVKIVAVQALHSYFEWIQENNFIQFSNPKLDRSRLPIHQLVELLNTKSWLREQELRVNIGKIARFAVCSSVDYS